MKRFYDSDSNNLESFRYNPNFHNMFSFVGKRSIYRPIPNEIYLNPKKYGFLIKHHIKIDLDWFDETESIFIDYDKELGTLPNSFLISVEITKNRVNESFTFEIIKSSINLPNNGEFRAIVIDKEELEDIYFNRLENILLNENKLPIFESVVMNSSIFEYEDSYSIQEVSTQNIFYYKLIK